MQSIVSLKYIGNSAILEINWDSKKGSLLSELTVKEKLIKKVREISIISLNFNLCRGTAFSIACEEIYAIVQRCGAKYLKISNCYLGSASIHYLIKMLKIHYIREINFDEVQLDDIALNDIIKNFNYLKVDIIYLNSRLNNTVLCETIKKLFDKRQELLKTKLTLLLIQKRRTYKNFPPRPVILLICEYLS